MKKKSKTEILKLCKLKSKNGDHKSTKISIIICKFPQTIPIIERSCTLRSKYTEIVNITANVSNEISIV
ncbi:MAG TPA: hypothetical protein DCP87_00610 [Lactobacillus sp.]|nr:hypothetical protein [Lactobacillus sp.]